MPNRIHPHWPSDVKPLRAIGSVVRMWAETPPIEWTDSLAEMLLYSQARVCKPGEYIYYDKALVSWHELGRNSLVDKAIGDWVLMLDTDHVFAPDLLERLLRLRAKYQTRVLSGLYQFKNPPHKPVANHWEGPKEAPKVVQLATWDPEAEVLPIGPCGGGCLLVDRNVFREIEARLGQQPFSIIPGLSEDYSFFRRCFDLDIPTFLAPKVQCHHLAPRRVLKIEDYQGKP